MHRGDVNHVPMQWPAAGDPNQPHANGLLSRSGFGHPSSWVVQLEGGPGRAVSPPRSGQPSDKTARTLPSGSGFEEPVGWRRRGGQGHHSMSALRSAHGSRSETVLGDDEPQRPASTTSGLERRDAVRVGHVGGRPSVVNAHRAPPSRAMSTYSSSSATWSRASVIGDLALDRKGGRRERERSLTSGLRVLRRRVKFLQGGTLSRPVLRAAHLSSFAASGPSLALAQLSGPAQSQVLPVDDNSSPFGDTDQRASDGRARLSRDFPRALPISQTGGQARPRRRQHGSPPRCRLSADPPTSSLPRALLEDQPRRTTGGLTEEQDADAPPGGGPR